MLKVWIPGTTDFHDQGLGGVTWANSGVTIDSSGKLGKCLYSGSGNMTTSNFSLSTKWSYSCWWKDSNTSAGWQYIFLLHNGTQHDSNSQMAFLSYPTQSRCEVCSNGKWYSTQAYTPGTWNHIAATYDGTTCKVYFNGIYTTSFTPGQTVTGTNLQIFRGANVYLNDLRIWDNEVISAKEIELLSRGLVIHYPLAMPGQENNIKASTIHNRGCNGFSYSSATNTWTMTAPIGSNAWGYGIVIDDTSIKWKSGESWVVSMEVYVPKAISWNHDINNKPDVSDTSPYTGNDYDNQRLYCSNGVMSSHNLQAGWNKIWFTQRAPATYGLFNYSTNFGIVTTNETSAIDIQIRNIKGEIISAGLEVKPTPWVPNPADTAYTALGFNDGIEYDVSGFKYNGEKYGDLKWSNNSAKYNTCYEFDGSSDYIRLKQDLYSQFRLARDEVTVNIWAYKDDWDDYKNSGSTAQWMTMCGCQEGGGFSIYEVGNGRFTFVCGTGASSNSYRTSGTSNGYADSLSSGWHMFTLTFDGLSLKGYVDGNLVVSNTFFTTKTPIYYNTGTTSIYIGVESGSGNQAGLWWKGKLSDFRVYTTALSASDILELYHTPITLANNGVLMTQGEFEES